MVFTLIFLFFLTGNVQTFHSSLYNSGFLQGVYRQLFLHLQRSW